MRETTWGPLSQSNSNTRVVQVRVGGTEVVRSGLIRDVFHRPWAGFTIGNEAGYERDREAMVFGLRNQTDGTALPEIRESCREAPGEERKSLECSFENIKPEMLISH